MAQRVKRRHHKDPAALRERSRLAGLASQQPDVLIRRLARMGLTVDQRQLLAEVAAGTDDGAARPEPGAFDPDLSLATSAVEGLGELLATWQARAEPDAPARRAGSAAITAIDTATAALYRIRVRLVSETRRADDEAAARDEPCIAAARVPGAAGRHQPPGTETAPAGHSPPKAAPDVEPPPSAIDMARVTRGGDRPGAP